MNDTRIVGSVFLWIC